MQLQNEFHLQHNSCFALLDKGCNHGKRRWATALSMQLQYEFHLQHNYVLLYINKRSTSVC